MEEQIQNLLRFTISQVKAKVLASFTKLSRLLSGEFSFQPLVSAHTTHTAHVVTLGRYGPASRITDFPYLRAPPISGVCLRRAAKAAPPRSPPLRRRCQDGRPAGSCRAHCLRRALRSRNPGSVAGGSSSRHRHSAGHCCAHRICARWPELGREGDQVRRTAIPRSTPGKAGVLESAS